jgi:hypothetical protein
MLSKQYSNICQSGFGTLESSTETRDYKNKNLQLITQDSVSWTSKQFKCELARTELVATGQSAIVTACSWTFQVLVYIYQLELGMTHFQVV